SLVVDGREKTSATINCNHSFFIHEMAHRTLRMFLLPAPDGCSRLQGSQIGKLKIIVTASLERIWFTMKNPKKKYHSAIRRAGLNSRSRRSVPTPSYGSLRCRVVRRYCHT